MIPLRAHSGTYLMASYSFQSQGFRKKPSAPLVFLSDPRFQEEAFCISLSLYSSFYHSSSILLSIIVYSFLPLFSSLSSIPSSSFSSFQSLNLHFLLILILSPLSYTIIAYPLIHYIILLFHFVSPHSLPILHKICSSLF